MGSSNRRLSASNTHKRQSTTYSQAIMHPQAPLALRLSSILQLGVVKLYKRQVDYLYEDCSAFLAKLRVIAYSTTLLSSRTSARTGNTLLIPSQQLKEGIFGEDDTLLFVPQYYEIGGDAGEQMLFLLDPPESGKRLRVPSSKKRKRDTSTSGISMERNEYIGEHDEVDYPIINMGDATVYANEVSDGLAGEFFVPQSMPNFVKPFSYGGPPSHVGRDTSVESGAHEIRDGYNVSLHEDDDTLLPVAQGLVDDEMELPQMGFEDDVDLPPPMNDYEMEQQLAEPATPSPHRQSHPGDVVFKSAQKPAHRRGRRHRNIQAVAIVDPATTIPSAEYREWTKVIPS